MSRRKHREIAQGASQPGLMTGVVAFATLLACEQPAWAGMPSVNLSYLAGLRLDAISFFLSGLLISAWGIRWLWNSIQRDFSLLPRLTYGKAVGLVVLWGLLFVIVLTMISGARELMTPGAWEKNGLTYRLSSKGGGESTDGSRAAVSSSEQAESGTLRERNVALERFWHELLKFAAMHGGQFPSQSDFEAFPTAVRELPDLPGIRYVYLEGRSIQKTDSILAHEPDVFDGPQLVLFADGRVKPMSSVELNSQSAAGTER